MKINKISCLKIVFITLLLSVSAFAQTATPAKIVLIDTDEFYDEKTGIVKIINFNRQLENEFAVQVSALKTGNARLQTIANELKAMQGLPKAQFNEAAYRNKQEEGERLQRELQYKQNELEAAVSKRRDVLMKPVNQDILKAIDEFAKKNGYGAIFDTSKLIKVGAMLYLGNNADVTKDFITFYNARSAAPTAPAKPK